MEVLSGHSWLVAGKRLRPVSSLCRSYTQYVRSRALSAVHLPAHGDLGRSVSSFWSQRHGRRGWGRCVRHADELAALGRIGISARTSGCRPAAGYRACLRRDSTTCGVHARQRSDHRSADRLRRVRQVDWTFLGLAMPAWVLICGGAWARGGAGEFFAAAPRALRAVALGHCFAEHQFQHHAVDL